MKGLALRAVLWSGAVGLVLFANPAWATAKPATKPATSTATPVPNNLMVTPDAYQHVPGMAPGYGVYQSPYLAADRSHPGHLAAAYYSVNGDKRAACYLGLSDDGGRSWRNIALVGAVPGVMFASADFESGSDECPEHFNGTTVVDFGADGALYYAFVLKGSTEDAPVHTYIMTSLDGGRSFSRPHAMLGPSGEGASTSKPSVTADPVTPGRVYMTWTDYVADDLPVILVATSNDHGETFPTIAKASPLVFGDGNQHSPYTSSIAVDSSGRMYVAWGDSITSPSSITPAGVQQLTTSQDVIQLSWSDDGGVTFKNCNPSGSPNTVVPVPVPSCDSSSPAGSLPASVGTHLSGQPVTVATYVTSGYSGPGEYGGRFFSGSAKFSLATGHAPEGTCAPGDRTGCRVYLAWFGVDGQHSRVSFAVSRDGSSWCPDLPSSICQPEHANMTGVLSTHDQTRPALSVTPEGDLFMAYYDVCQALAGASPAEPGSCDDATDVATCFTSASACTTGSCYDVNATGATCLQHVYIRVSKDGGGTFTPPQRISDMPSDTRVGPFVGVGGIGTGDTLGLASYSGSSGESSGYYAVWTDTRRGCPTTKAMLKAPPVSGPCTLNSAGRQDIFFASPQLPLECPALPVPQPGQRAVPSGYSLVSMPTAGVTTFLSSESFLNVPYMAPLEPVPLKASYGWSDQPAGSSYMIAPSNETGHGYWAWFRCPALLTMPLGEEGDRTTEPLHAFHASIVGNPSATRQMLVRGFDFAAVWDPTLNNRVGGYHYSGYRQAAILDVGQGLWVVSYVDTTVTLTPA